MTETEETKISWQDNARLYFKRCYDCNFDVGHGFKKGKTLCQVIGAAMYGENADCEADDDDETKFGYSEDKTKHILKVQQAFKIFF